MVNRYFASDHHLWHENIVKFQNRPFSNAKEMNEFLLTMHNQIVRPEDHFSFLGDITLLRGGRVQQDIFIKEMKKYNGHGRLFLGNHDHFPIKTYIEAGFEKVYATWRDEQGLLFSHMPLHPTSIGSARANIHGHIHQNKSPQPAAFLDKTGKEWIKPYINISVEATGYSPIHYDQIMERVNQSIKDYKSMHTTPKNASLDGS